MIALLVSLALAQDDTDTTARGVEAPVVYRLHHTEVRMTRLPAPKYPSDGRELDLGTVLCRALVLFDEAGVPYEVDPQACPALFADPTRQALLATRFEPHLHLGEPVHVQSLITVRFEPR